MLLIGGQTSASPFDDLSFFIHSVCPCPVAISLLQSLGLRYSTPTFRNVLA